MKQTSIYKTSRQEHFCSEITKKHEAICQIGIATISSIRRRHAIEYKRHFCPIHLE